MLKSIETVIARPLLWRIGFNSLWLLLARVISQGLMLIFSILVARYLGETGLGQYAFIASIIFLGNIATTFGMDTLLIREIAKTRETKTNLVPAALWIQLALSIAFIAAIFFGGSAFTNKTPETIFALKLYALSLIPLALYTTISAILRAFERMDLYLTLNASAALAQTGGAWWLLTTHANLVELVYLLLGIQIVAALFAVALGKWQIPGFAFQWHLPRAELQPILRAAMPFALLITLAVVYQRLGVLMLSTLAGDAATGSFSAAARIVEAIKMVPQAFLGSLFPIMAHRAFTSKPNMLFQNSLLALVGFGALAATAIYVFAQPTIELLYGASFQSSVPALQILGWSMIPYAISAHTSLELVSKNRERVVLIITLISLVIAFALNLALIPGFGVIGVCASALASECAQAIMFRMVAQ